MEVGVPERREQPGERAGFLAVEPKNAWAGGGGRVKPGRRVELESVEKSRNQERGEIPNSSLSLPDVPALSARTRPAVSLNGLGGRKLVGGPRI